MSWPNPLHTHSYAVDLLASAFQFTDLGLDSTTRSASRFGEKAGISVGGQRNAG